MNPTNVHGIDFMCNKKIGSKVVVNIMVFYLVRISVYHSHGERDFEAVY